MIKILLDNKVKKEIENIFIEDAINSPSGLFSVLEEGETRDYLRKNFGNIYNILYDIETESVSIEKVKKLLLANRKTMRNYINELGDYSDKDKKQELLQKVFRYDTYSKRVAAIHILKKMKVTVCPYCNRQYIFTLINSNVRPQFDHYYPKSKYPYLALSLYNMVPCCGICNAAKSSLDTSNEPVLYPFDEEMGDDACFRIKTSDEGSFVKIIQGASDQFDIVLKFNKQKNEKVIRTQFEKLHLGELYNEHKAYVQDIIKTKYVNSSGHIEQLLKNFPMLFSTRDEVKNMIYMTEIRKEMWGDRILSKLTYDIDQQFEEKSIGLKEK